MEAIFLTHRPQPTRHQPAAKAPKQPRTPHTGNQSNGQKTANGMAKGRKTHAERPSFRFQKTAFHTVSKHRPQHCRL